MKLDDVFVCICGLKDKRADIKINKKYNVLGTNSRGDTVWVYDNDRNSAQLIHWIKIKHFDKYFMKIEKYRKLKLQKINGT